MNRLLILLFIAGCSPTEQYLVEQQTAEHTINVLVVHDSLIDVLALEADFQTVRDIMVNSYLDDYVEFNFTVALVNNKFVWPGDNINANEYLVHNSEVQLLRDLHGADVVIGINTNPSFAGGTGKLFVDSNTVEGWTYYTYTEIEQEAYAIVAVDELGKDDYVFAHELFHTFGLQHDLQTAYIDWNVSNAYPYAHAYQSDTECTVMARACQRELILADKDELFDSVYSSNNRQRFIETVLVIEDFRF